MNFFQLVGAQALDAECGIVTSGAASASRCAM